MATSSSEIRITNKTGLHARPVTQFVQLANKFQSKVEVVKGAQVVDGKSVMSMLLLGAECGSSLTIRAKGPDADEAIQGLTALISKLGQGEAEAAGEAGTP